MSYSVFSRTDKKSPLKTRGKGLSYEVAKRMQALCKRQGELVVYIEKE